MVGTERRVFLIEEGLILRVWGVAVVAAGLVDPRMGVVLALEGGELDKEDIQNVYACAVRPSASSIDIRH